MAKGGKRRGGKRGGGKRGKKGAKKSASNVSDYASLSVKNSLTVANGFTSNRLYSLMNTTLALYPRAVTVSQAYQFYRIRKIALTIKPTFDTYQAIGFNGSGVGGIGKPNLYYMIDKSGSIPTNVSLEALKQMGARPRQLDEKNMTVSWTPTVLEASLQSGGNSPTVAGAKYDISPWLTTTAIVVGPGVFVPSEIDHLGIYWYCDQSVGLPVGFTPPTFTVEVEVQFEFKKPLSVLSQSDPAIPAQHARLNDSPDGIVGGNDGI